MDVKEGAHSSAGLGILRGEFCVPGICRILSRETGSDGGRGRGAKKVDGAHGPFSQLTSVMRKLSVHAIGGRSRCVMRPEGSRSALPCTIRV